VRRRNGTVFPAKLALNAVPRADGSHYVIGLIDDVTAEEIATKQRLELLAEAAQARSDAEAANRAKDTFFASLSHELRSPLNACVMWLDVLALGPHPDKVPKAVEAIRRNLGRQTRLVNDLIDAAKISSGGIEVHLEPLDLTALLKRNVDTWQLLAIAKQLSFEHQLEPTAARVQADSDRLLQVLNNLIENAVDNTPAGGHVTLTLRNAGDVCLIEVEDTGVGLSADDAASLFTPFWRSPGNTHSHKGLGLGLAIAHHLVTKHGGTLAAASDGLGAGTVFTVSLPLRTERSDDRHSDAIASTAS
jgi:signal transduction histidine kinase